VYGAVLSGLICKTLHKIALPWNQERVRERGDGETRRQGDGEMGREGEKETRRNLKLHTYYLQLTPNS
jgi:hypothetical protein